MFLKHLLTAYNIYIYIYIYIYILQTSGNTLYERVILIVTDAAPYMVAAFKNLKQSLLPKLIRVTCIVHDIHRVCKIIREENVKVN